MCTAITLLYVRHAARSVSRRAPCPAIPVVHEHTHYVGVVVVFVAVSRQSPNERWRTYVLFLRNCTVGVGPTAPVTVRCCTCCPGRCAGMSFGTEPSGHLISPAQKWCQPHWVCGMCAQDMRLQPIRCATQPRKLPNRYRLCVHLYAHENELLDWLALMTEHIQRARKQVKRKRKHTINKWR